MIYLKILVFFLNPFISALSLENSTSVKIYCVWDRASKIVRSHSRFFCTRVRIVIVRMNVEFYDTKVAWHYDRITIVWAENKFRKVPMPIMNEFN